ncbi:alpha/beta hydrolase [Streptomyces ovatisporus]|uniref:Alpha/beta hydrolase n=1 Tax=Streptomyces ovatisporus TaxID=1128682 RepID=A0ABV9AEV8_9ACTN
MRLRTAAVAATSALGAGVAAVAAGRYAADAALRPARSAPAAGRGHLPAGFGGPSLTVHEVGAGHIALTRSLTARLPGTYGLVGRGCHAVVGPVLGGEHQARAAADTVVRRLERITYGELTPRTKVWLTPQVCTGGPGDALGVDRTETEVPGELGPLPAWFVPGRRDIWVVALHGLGAGPEQPLPLLPFYAAQGLPVLGLSYRGDPGAPAPPGGVRHLGDTEWHDVAAAVRHAVRQGAAQVVLHGWSSGASMALRAADELRRRPGVQPGEGSAVGRISGLVLDSPVLDWWATLRALAAARHVPRPLLPLAVRAAQGRARVAEPERLAPVTDPARLAVPTLIVHGPNDVIAPWEASTAFAAAREELVSLYPVPHAPHAAMWNADPAEYEERLRRFLTPLL